MTNQKAWQAYILKIHYIIYSVVLVFTLSCDMIEVSDIPIYPLKIEQLEFSTLQELNARYHQENRGHVCSTLNQYGFTGFSRILFPGDQNPCLNKEAVRIEITDTDSLISLAKSSLLKNKEYTLVDDTTSLEVTEVLNLFGCTICEGPQINSVPIELKVSFAAQQFDGVEVSDSEITVFVDAKGVNRIWGNWYPDFEVNGLLNVGYNTARSKLIGLQLDMNKGAEGNNVFTVTEENLKSEPVFQFVPFANNKALELRKAWKVFIEYPEAEFAGWYAFIDVMDGSILKISDIITNN